MGKFRSKDRHKLELQNFSVGSTISTGPSDPKWLVVETSAGEVALVNMETWKVTSGVKVVDPHWLTIDEAGALAIATGLNYTRSDYDFNEEGLKGLK